MPLDMLGLGVQFIECSIVDEHLSQGEVTMKRWSEEVQIPKK